MNVFFTPVLREAYQYCSITFSVAGCVMDLQCRSAQLQDKGPQCSWMSKVGITTLAIGEAVRGYQTFAIALVASLSSCIYHEKTLLPKEDSLNRYCHVTYRFLNLGYHFLVSNRHPGMGEGGMGDGRFSFSRCYGLRTPLSFLSVRHVRG
jgi:hypothetical protein